MDKLKSKTNRYNMCLGARYCSFKNNISYQVILLYLHFKSFALGNKVAVWFTNVHVGYTFSWRIQETGTPYYKVYGKTFQYLLYITLEEILMKWPLYNWYKKWLMSLMLIVYKKLIWKTENKKYFHASKCFKLSKSQLKMMTCYDNIDKCIY